MFAAIRIRGSVNVREDIKDTLKMLRLNKVNHCVIVPETPKYVGMLRKTKDRITWGTIDKKTLTELLKKRARLVGNKPIDEKILKEITGFENFEDFAKNLLNGKVDLREFAKIKPIFRLNPPRKGYKTTRLPYPKGDLGFRKEGIDKLIERMI